ncbi:CinA family protein [Simkania negevensis]|uniref:CinA family protein n=1 Tax=Simkania negevensis TaxID=83561 RepID=A0ABS3AT38_9BACT|nr:CinA family protein [Simkania negevensis]
MKIEEELHHLFVTKKLSLAIAESCTGGAIAALLTRVPGASDYFLGGVVAYSSRLKEQSLNVSVATLYAKGAVSEQVAEEMARGVHSLCQSSYAIGVSGIAGPSGGSPDKPVGTVCCAIVGEGGLCTSWTLHLKGDRKTIIDTSVYAILTALKDLVESIE